jgi:hypothetical protein
VEGNQVANDGEGDWIREGYVMLNLFQDVHENDLNLNNVIISK